MRESYSLPLGWRFLTRVDIDQLKALLSELATPNADLAMLETCLLIWASLVTGRHPAQLLSFTVRMMAAGERLADAAAGMVGRAGKWGWWLPAGAPPGQRNTTAAMCETSPGLYLPTTRTVAELVARCIALRRRASAGRVHLSGLAVPLFTTGEPLLRRVSQVLADRHPVGAHRTRRSTVTPEAIARWLPAELVGAAGGDVVPASIITGRVPRHAQTAIFYGAIRHDELVRQYREAVRSVDELSHHQIPADLITSYLGDRLTPKDENVRALAAGLADSLNDENLDEGERHTAMTSYTVALLGFALAHRGSSGSLPSKQDVDACTRLFWIHDKAVSGTPTRRLVWICDAALRQLELYETHLDRLQARVSPAAAVAIAELRMERGLALFDMRSGRIARLRVAEAINAATRHYGLPKNAGRHWLRARLVGRCSTETLHALFGHGAVGDGSWDARSALDPAAYRADLARVLDPALHSVGWCPRSADGETA